MEITSINYSSTYLSKQQGENVVSVKKDTEADNNTADNNKEEEIIVEVQRLKVREQEVIAHENAHRSVGGQYAGAIQYEYTKGPDGRSYITGGEVSIDVSKEKDPDDTVAKMQQVRRAALAPANPSAQDYSVASKATQIEQQAKIERVQVDDSTGDSKEVPAEVSEDTEQIENQDTDTKESKTARQYFSAIAFKAYSFFFSGGHQQQQIISIYV
ncbi:MAG: hypothetical protein L3V56_05460 [Candidatus Magnetoovum sp. WYHC-5]|nr:hypothetical protein [Candidatus Magnetoovum sp. WYHC-5]